MTPEYIAGFFDADGHVTISLSGSLQVQRGIRQKVFFRIQCGFTNNHIGVLQQIKDTLGLPGGINLTAKRNSDKHSTTYHLMYYGRYCVKVLEAMVPYLVVKQERAKLALSFQARREGRGRRWNTDGSLRRTTDADLAADLVYRNEMIKLNGTGSKGINIESLWPISR